MIHGLMQYNVSHINCIRTYDLSPYKVSHYCFQCFISYHHQTESYKYTSISSTSHGVGEHSTKLLDGS
jgi:hypothetical protein